MAKPKLKNLPDLSDLARSGADILVRVTPGATQAGITRDGQKLRVSVSVPAERGKANAAVQKLVAAAMGVAPSNLTLVRGQTGRDKVFRYSDGVSRN